jgi:hypothetical protein
MISNSIWLHDCGLVPLYRDGAPYRRCQESGDLVRMVLRNGRVPQRPRAGCWTVRTAMGHKIARRWRPKFSERLSEEQCNTANRRGTRLDRSRARFSTSALASCELSEGCPSDPDRERCRVRRDQIERVADLIDCAKLSEPVRRLGQRANIAPLCSRAVDVICGMSVSSRSVFVPLAPIIVVPFDRWHG